MHYTSLPDLHHMEMCRERRNHVEACRRAWENMTTYPFTSFISTTIARHCACCYHKKEGSVPTAAAQLARRGASSRPLMRTASLVPGSQGLQSLCRRPSGRESISLVSVLLSRCVKEQVPATRNTEMAGRASSFLVFTELAIRRCANEDGRQKWQAEHPSFCFFHRVLQKEPKKASRR